MKFYIYAIYFPTSNKYYIGQTQNLRMRLYYHLKNPLLVGKALRKYDDWQIEILHTCKTRDAANLLEIEEIRHYNCVAPNGYNLSRGGESGANGVHHTEKWKGDRRKEMEGNQFAKGLKWTKEQKDLKSKNSQGEKNNFYGYKHSKEALEKMRKNAAMNNPKAKLKWRISRLKTSIRKLKDNL